MDTVSKLTHFDEDVHKPLYEPMLEYGQFDPCEQTSVKC